MLPLAERVPLLAGRAQSTHSPGIGELRAMHFIRSACAGQGCSRRSRPKVRVSQIDPFKTLARDSLPEGLP